MFLISIVGYFAISKYLCAEYFTPIINTEWVKLLLNDFDKGIQNVFEILKTSMDTYIETMKQGIITGEKFGAWCASFTLTFVWIIYFCIKNLIEKKNMLVSIYWVGCFFVILTAVFLLYSILAGSKHFLVFIVVAICLLAMKEKSNIIIIIFSIAFALLFTVKTDVSFNVLPVKTQEMVEEINTGMEMLSEEMVVVEGADPWDNTAIMLISDGYAIKWQDLYSCPAGFGINVCTQNFVLNNYDNLKSKYLFTTIGQYVDAMCNEKGAELIAEYGGVHVWKLRE